MSLKQKNIALLLGFLITLALAYNYSYHKTFVAKKNYNSLVKDNSDYKNSAALLVNLKQKNRYLDALLTKYKINKNSIQNSLLQYVTTSAKIHDVQLLDFNEPHIAKVKQQKSYTTVFTLQGSYNSILKMLYDLEQNAKFGRIISVKISKKKNYLKNKYYLQAQIFLQNKSA